MNSHSYSQQDDLPLFDRLVDGELSESERREILNRLEREPDGWRRLALAFLEAQCWRETSREPQSAATTLSISASSSDSSGKSEVMSILPPRKAGSSRFGAPLAMAASFLVAFTLGLALRGAWTSSNNSAPSMATNQTTQTDALAAAGGDDGLATPLGEHPVDNLAENAEPNEVWMAADAPDSDESVLSGGPSQAVPASVLQSLRRMGRVVETQRSLWPVDLENGQRALVPVDEVEIRYVGNQYQ